jgi:hypothetical protein
LVFYYFYFRVGLPLPYTEKPDGPRLILIRPGAYDASIYTVAEMIKISNMIQDILMNEGEIKLAFYLEDFSLLSINNSKHLQLFAVNP